MKVQSSRGLGGLQALSSERRVKPKELHELKQFFDNKFLRKPGSRLRNLQERVSRDSQITTSSAFPSNFLNTGVQKKERSIDLKQNYRDKCPPKLAIDSIVRKTQVNEILNSISKGRSPSVGRLAFQDVPVQRSTTALSNIRPSSSLGKISHSKTPTISGKINFGKEFDTKNLVSSKGKPNTLLEEWLKSSKKAFRTSNTETVNEKKRKITQIHQVLNRSEAGLGISKGENGLSKGTNTYQNLLSKFSLNPPSTFHLNSSKPIPKSGSSLYQKIISNNGRGEKRLQDNTTSQLLFENQKLFEKKKQAFKDGGLD